MRHLRVPLLILALALVAALLDREAGLVRYHDLRADLDAAEARVDALRQSIHALETHRDALDDDEFAIETAIRRDLGLARPGEIIVQHGPRESLLVGLP